MFTCGELLTALNLFQIASWWLRLLLTEVEISRTSFQCNLRDHENTTVLRKAFTDKAFSLHTGYCWKSVNSNFCSLRSQKLLCYRFIIQLQHDLSAI